MNDARSRVAYRKYCKELQPVRHQAGAVVMRSKAARGFTIVETLIVLTVAMALFISATILVAGQQNKVEFSQAVRDIQANIQATINEVGAGYYPNRSNFKCSAIGNALSITTGATAQGSNTGCIFLGKAIEFGVSGTDPQDYVVHTIAGLQDNSGSIVTANPKDIAPGITTNNNPNFPDASVTNQLHNGLTVNSMTYTNGAITQDIGAVAFVSQLGQYSGGNLLSGTQQITLMPVKNSGSAAPLSTTAAGTADAINNYLKSSPVNPDGGVSICFTSGTTHQSGLVRIGSNDRTLSVTLDIKGSKDCT